jgi:formylglycine-generating enzyme required for sulfatase activity
MIAWSGIFVCQLHSQTAIVPQSQAIVASASANDHKLEVRLATNGPDPRPPYGMVLIPAGEVTVGIDVDEAVKLGQRDEFRTALIGGETPRHSRDIGAFYLDATEVTNLQWMVYLKATGREPSSTLVQFGWPGGKIPKGQEYNPITNVNLPEVEGFLAWCGKRLPTEFEWTRAARGDDTRDYPWGDKWDPKVVKYSGTPPQMTCEVDACEDGQSPFGVLNMSGNVFEWTDSPYVKFPGWEPLKFKTGRKSQLLSADFNSRRRVAKGGCFVSTRHDARIDYRLSLDPSDSDEALGFRCARSVEDGLDIVRHGYRRLLPPQIPSLEILDETDIFSQEFLSYRAGSNGRIIDGHRYLVFSHPKADRQPGLGRMRKTAKDAPVALGLLVSSEELESPNLPAGAYVVSFKGKGESKKYKEKQKLDRKSEKSSKKEEEPPAPEPEAGERGSGGIVPWPGIAVSDIIHDIEFPQDEEVYLFYNVNNAVVGWLPAGEIMEDPRSPTSFNESNEGKDWVIEFSLDVVSKRVPRFTLPIRLRNQGLVDH